MNEKLDNLYYELFRHLKFLVDCAEDRAATSAELENIPEVARALIDLIILQSQM